MENHLEVIEGRPSDLLLYLALHYTRWQDTDPAEVTLDNLSWMRLYAIASDMEKRMGALCAAALSLLIERQVAPSVVEASIDDPQSCTPEAACRYLAALFEAEVTLSEFSTTDLTKVYLATGALMLSLADITTMAREHLEGNDLYSGPADANT